MTHLSSTAWCWLLAFCLSCSVFLASPIVTRAAELADTDGDGLADVWETSVYLTDPAKTDTDADGFDDRIEIMQGFSPLVKSKAKVKDTDTDKDGLSNRLELFFGTDPSIADTDGDGSSDGKEVMAAFSPTSTEPIALPKSLYIILATQRLEQRVMGIPVASYPISSGKRSTPTPVGTYQVLNKHPRAWSRMAKLWMPDWMAFTTKGHGIHELPEWPSGLKEGAAHLGIPVSHGCVRLGIGPAKKIYDWSPIGTPVIVSYR